MTDIINEEENTTPLPEEEQETVVVDNGQTYESTESAIIAKEEADRAKLWAQESERQANIATRGAEDAAQAKDDAEAAVTDANVVAVGTDLRATPSNIKTVASNISDVTTVATNSANITAVANNATNINAVNANKTNIDAVASNETNITAVANNATNINAVNANKTNIDAVAGNNTDISAVAADLTNIDAVAADLTNIDNASANAQLARDWAVKMDGLVGNTDYSSKYYAQQAQASAASVDNTNIVHKTGDETITGTKSYIAMPALIFPNETRGTAPSSTTYGGIAFLDNNGERMAILEKDHLTDGSICLNLRAANPTTTGTESQATLGVKYPISGNPYATAPASDANGSIVTTVNKTKASNGYYKFGNGLIIQWGQNDVSNHIVNVTLPTAFTSTGYQLSAIRKSGTTTTSESDPFYCRDKTTTTFQLYNPGSNAASATWIAIGY